MEKVMSVNGFIASLPKIRRRRIWNVVIDGKVVQGVSATDNRKSTAEAYIAEKYPNTQFTLVFVQWKIWGYPIMGVAKSKTFGIMVEKKEKRKKMKNIKMKIVQEIIGLRYELDNYRNDKDWIMVRKIRLEIAKLENMLSETYWLRKNTC
jgi:hypothetical protein